MSSSRTCARCLHRQHGQLRHAVRTLNQQSRPFSSYVPRLQQPSDPLSTPLENASDPSSGGAAKPQPSDARRPNTAPLQRAIISSLSTPSLPTTLAAKLRKTVPKLTTQYVAYGVARALFDVCQTQANYSIPVEKRTSILTGEGPAKTADGEDLGIPDDPSSSGDGDKTATATAAPTSNFWFTTLALPPTFSTWSSVTFLHMYMLLVRIRALDLPATTFSQYQHHLYDHFSHAAEDKMALYHGMAARSVRNKYLRDLFLQWRGVVVAFDEGLITGDTAFAGAVWRNLFKGRETVDWQEVVMVVRFMRKGMEGLGRLRDEDLVAAVVGGDNGVGIFEKAKAGLNKGGIKEGRGMRENIGQANKMTAKA